MTRQSRPRPATRPLASLVVLVGSTLLLGALQTEPRSVPLLLVVAATMLGGLWLLMAGRAAAGRTWGVLGAGLIGGALGLFALSDVTSTSFPHDVVAGFASLAAFVGPYAAAAGFLLALIWPEYWWRWGLILSWGFVVVGLVSTDAFVWLPLLPLMALPFLGARAGALLRERVRLADR